GGRRGSGLQHFGEGFETRLDRGSIEIRHLRTSAGGDGSCRRASPGASSRAASKISQDGRQNTAKPPLPSSGRSRRGRWRLPRTHRTPVAAQYLAENGAKPPPPSSRTRRGKRLV